MTTFFVIVPSVVPNLGKAPGTCMSNCTASEKERSPSISRNPLNSHSDMCKPLIPHASSACPPTIFLNVTPKI